MKTITLEDFKKLDYNPYGISNYRLTDGKCIKCCSHFEYSLVKKFLRNRSTKLDKKDLWDTCSKCWLIINTAENKEWRDKNSKAQLIAQNKPEQKAKNALGVSKSWTKERRAKGSEYTRNRWKNDPEFRAISSKNLNWTSKNDEKYNEIMSRSFGCGGLKGIYANIRYESALEMSYIMWCEDNNIDIKRYDLDPLPYKDENDKDRLYFPDFIINNDTIVEIKGFGLYYRKNHNRNILKIESLKYWCSENGYKYYLILEKDKILQTNYSRARRKHHENQKKNSDKI